MMNDTEMSFRIISECPSVVIDISILKQNCLLIIFVWIWISCILFRQCD